MDMERQSTAWMAVTRLAVALAGYRADRGQYPEKLDDLTPDYVKSVPPDPFTDQPLIYRVTADGYLLYSVGRNGVDDGGTGDDPEAKMPDH